MEGLAMTDIPSSTTITKFNGDQVHYVDGVPTVLLKVRGDIASGYTINNDLTTTACFVARGHGYFAHGKTAHEASSELERKIISNMNTDDKVDEFIRKFDKDGTYPTKSFYDWHGILTGSCVFGRDSFAKEHNVDLNGNMSTRDFLLLTKDAFGREIIRAIMERLDIKDE